MEEIRHLSKLVLAENAGTWDSDDTTQLSNHLAINSLFLQWVGAFWRGHQGMKAINPPKTNMRPENDGFQ